MAAARSSPEEITLKTLAVCLSTLLLTCAKAGGVNIDRLTDQDVDHLLDNSCVLVGIEPAVPELLDTLTQLASIYGDDKQVVSVGTIAKYYFLGPSKSQLRVKSVSGTVAPIGELYEGADLLLFKRRVKDRTCLIHPAHIRAGPVGEIPSGPRTLRALVDLINEGCNGFRDMDGRYTVAGHHRNHILNNLFHVQMISNISMGLVADSLISSNRTNVELNLFTSLKNIPSTFQTQGRCFQSGMNSACHILDVFTENPEFDMKVTHSKEPKFSKSKKSACDVLSYSPSTEHFFHEYLKRSRPFIVRNITSSWPAFKKWTNNFLRSEFGKNNVHVKLTPSGDYEGVESSKLWENYETFKIPTEVRSQLKFPDLVTVRPAGVNMNFSDFLDLVERAAREGVEERKVSAYLEYSSIPDYMPALEADIIEPRFTKDLLKRSHLNLWLSDGHTLGRLHFDQYDNVLCQISGTKEVILFDPHDNRRLYEAHIPQATLSYNKVTKKFRRRKLEDSTSMVMAPIDLKNPNFERFPLFADAHPLLCTIHEGDALFMPSFWWHEVQSSPSQTLSRNLAVNLWYEPFLKREFPCQECTLDINKKYQHLLTSRTL